MRQEGIIQQEEFINGVDQGNEQRPDKKRNRRRIFLLRMRAKVLPKSEIYVSDEGKEVNKHLQRMKLRLRQKKSFSSLNLDYEIPPF
eukprot:CAMPEP_0195285796 /NCGR_PEP_ID=MMETSP0707-20130614/3506_1 /TAXON_ID=33640 /ORGANISM="Asterionellopsis glacialis, Strain CCMP134" /LENGTH=86 /DNA_ID=CAMNT_0040345349 /DNA_START=196 /DNA_END=456 /DNA_ORIENTATION=+